MSVKRSYGIGIALFVLGLFLLPQQAICEEKPWLDNQRQFSSSDPKYNARRSEHFRIMWGKGAAGQREENADFGQVTEELAQGNLQMLEQLFHLFHDPMPKGMGFHKTGESNTPANNDGNLYRINMMMNNTGIWAGGAWGACDDWGYPLFALPPSYLRFDPPSGATPHEYGHTVLINAGGFNDTPYDGMWHEATANWLQLQFNNSYPGPGGVGVQPYLSLPHGRNYYDAWQIYECLREDPKYGFPFIAKLWKEANGSRAKGAEYIFDAMVRLDTSGSPDPYNAIKDVIGKTAAHNVMWDYERRMYFQKQSERTMDPFNDMYRRAYTELVRRNGDKTWYRVPFAQAPMQGGYNVVPIALEGKEGGGYTVTIDFQPLWDPIRRSDWRATLVAVNDKGESRYSTTWNRGVNSITLSADENRVYLAVAATPDFMGFEGFSHPLISDLPLQPQAYEVAFVDTKAAVYESKPQKPANAAGTAHGNGGGFVQDSAKVEPTAYVGPNAMVLDRAQVLGNARVEDYAVVAGSAVVKDNAIVSGHALVRDQAEIRDNGKVRDWATVAGRWDVYENGRALERASLADRGKLHGNATIKGNVPDYGGADVSGHAIKEGDCANSANVDHQVLMCWVWSIDQAYADQQFDTGGLYCRYSFKKESPIYALDFLGVIHGYLMGEPKTVAVNDTVCSAALLLNGKNQYVELKKDVSDFKDTTIAAWVNWTGNSGDQRIFNFGDGDKKYAYLTPKDQTTGKVKFAISANGKEGEQALVGTAALPSKTWSHVAVTLKGDVGTLYVDGAPVVANEKMTLDPDVVLAPNCLAGNDAAYIGRGPEGNYYAGLITDFRVYVEPQDATAVAKLAGMMADKSVGIVQAPEDKTPPSPSKPEFLMKPQLVGDNAVVMSAVRGTDESNWVEYCFTSTQGGHTSGWISSNRWTDCMIEQGKTCAYIVEMRDKYGNKTAPSNPVGVVVPKDTTAPAPAEFEYGPVGVGTSEIRMTAAEADDACSLVEYQFTRSDGKKTGWQSSRNWTDTGLTEGTEYSYTVQVRDGSGNVGKTSLPKSAKARDDDPPARYKRGEWQSLPYSTLDNKVAMRAMSVNGRNDCPKIENGDVEYYFHCTSGNGPDSGWIDDTFYKTPTLPDGSYTYQFKIRDKSPQKNETKYSSEETARVSPLTGYHEYAIGKVLAQPEGSLATFKGKVTEVNTEYYTVSDGDNSVKVMPKTVACETDPEMKDREVMVSGCVWSCSDEKRITWSELK